MLSLKSFNKKKKKKNNSRASDWQVTDLWASSAPPVIHHEGTVLTSTSLFKHSGARAESSLASTRAPLKYFANTDLQHCKVSNNDKNYSIFLTSAKNKKLQTAAQPVCVCTGQLHWDSWRHRNTGTLVKGQITHWETPLGPTSAVLHQPDNYTITHRH